jgi:hypothetical protein
VLFHRVVFSMCINVSEKYTASIFRAKVTSLLRNESFLFDKRIGTCFPDEQRQVSQELYFMESVYLISL